LLVLFLSFGALRFLYLLFFPFCGIRTRVISGFGGMQLKIQTNPD
jgi:hypothetical protein